MMGNGHNEGYFIFRLNNDGTSRCDYYVFPLKLNLQYRPNTVGGGHFNHLANEMMARLHTFNAQRLTQQNGKPIKDYLVRVHVPTMTMTLVSGLYMNPRGSAFVPTQSIDEIPGLGFPIQWGG